MSNPNKESTAPYLFYELQLRYSIDEHLYRARPVNLIAQDVPPPHEVDEALGTQSRLPSVISLIPGLGQ